MDDHLYSLVESDVLSTLRQCGPESLSRIRDEIAYRIDQDDLTMDTSFMNSVLDRLSDIIRGDAPRPAMQYNIEPLDAIPHAEETKDAKLLREEKKKSLEEGEEVLESTVQEQSKYKSPISFTPKNPLSYNKVKTGVVWNKYAQTHYDESNPPPKQILGYRFNIFYPDLLDVTKAPKYDFESGSSPDTLRIRVAAGPPYEDAVFEIVNKQWDTDRKFGYRCDFEGGILRLHFDLKREKYRR
jgi:hypothetical protein